MSQTLRLALLALLSNGPNSGYGLGRVLDKDLHHIWSAKTQQIYHELARLDAEGFIRINKRTARSNRPDKKVYAITPAGLDDLERGLLEDTPAAATKEELLVHVYAVERAPGIVLARLKAHGTRCEEKARELKEQRNATDRTEPGQFGVWLTLDAALSRATAEAEWARRAVAAIRKAGLS